MTFRKTFAVINRIVTTTKNLGQAEKLDENF